MRQYVGIVLVRLDGSVLAQHRDNIPTILGPNTWGVVGGVRENDKDLKSTAARKLEEETGYIVDKKDLRFLARDTYRTEQGIEVERIILWALKDVRQKINTKEGQLIRFVNPSELNTLPLYAGHRAFLKKASEKVFGGSIERKA